MDDFAGLRSYLDGQAAFCRGSGSPFSALAVEQMAARVGEGGLYDAAFAPWRRATGREAFGDAAGLRLLGAFHYLALSGRAPELAALYPPADSPQPAILAAALADALAAHPDIIGGFMASPPQTNEVGRAFCLVGGFLTVAAETGLPLRCLELGASAGLNMNWDLYGYRFGEEARWGDPAAPVQLAGAWTGVAPPAVTVRVAEKRGCDVNPIDVADEDQALRLQSYVWAGQDARLERLRGAIALKRATGGAPDLADAGDWCEAHVHPAPGLATVVYHSVFLQYPPAAVQARIRSAIAAAGAAATTAAPLAWLRMEPNPDDLGAPMEVRLTFWPGGGDRLLARVHPHGASAAWLCGA